jgi:hypothetical protein
MKLSSFFILILIILTFLTIQGWVVVRKFGGPEQLVVEDAILTGPIITVSSPVSGLVTEVNVRDGQPIAQGQKLFVIEPYPAAEEGSTSRSHEIIAQRSGVFTDTRAAEGSFIHFNEKLGSIVDKNIDTLRVTGQVSIAPERLALVRTVLLSTVQAEYLNGGQPMEAMVDAVDPSYNAANQTIGVKLRLTAVPAELHGLPLGLPVVATIQLGTITPLGGFVQDLQQKLSFL